MSLLFRQGFAGMCRNGFLQSEAGRGLTLRNVDGVRLQLPDSAVQWPPPPLLYIPTHGFCSRQEFWILWYGQCYAPPTTACGGPPPPRGRTFLFLPEILLHQSRLQKLLLSRSRRSTDLCPPPGGRGTAERWWGDSRAAPIFVRPLGGGGPRSGGGGIPPFLYCKGIIAILLSFIAVHRRSMTITPNFCDPRKFCCGKI